MKHVRTEIIITVCSFVGEGLDDPDQMIDTPADASASICLKRIESLQRDAATLTKEHVAALLKNAGDCLPEVLAHKIRNPKSNS